MRDERIRRCEPDEPVIPAAERREGPSRYIGEPTGSSVVWADGPNRVSRPAAPARSPNNFDPPTGTDYLHAAHADPTPSRP